MVAENLMDDDTKHDWERMLRHMVSQFRAQNPNDPRSDRELLEGLMEHFHQAGVVGKANGKYLIPTLVDEEVETVQ